VTWSAVGNLVLAAGVLFWIASAYWVYKDARRRIDDPWLVGLATFIGLVPPFVGPFIYMLFRPPESLEDIRERELEIRAIEDGLAQRTQCPVCRTPVERTFLVCPVCTTKLRQACANCKAPLDPIWQVCPYCTAPVAAAEPTTLPGRGS
jgi:RNA polymerase subunit RPABC4/transcription elongation factor Spt4